MYKFQEWVAIRETVEGEIMRLKFIYPKARASKIASIMREKGYNLGATEVRHVIKKWETQSPEMDALRHHITDKRLNKQVAFFLDRNPNLTPEQVIGLLRNNGIFAEPWQVEILVNKYRKPVPQPQPQKTTPAYTPDLWSIDKSDYIPSRPASPPMNKPVSKPLFRRPKEEDDDEKDFDPPDNIGLFFNQGTGGGARVRRSTRYN